MSEKGEEIRFSGGKYRGKTGWLDKGRAVTTCSCWVIIKMDEAKELTTMLRQSSVKMIVNGGVPKTYEEAVLQQHPDIESLMEKLATELAKCNLSPSSVTIHEIVEIKLREARAAQALKGNKATWHEVDFEGDDGAPEI
jgi:hypothetical protein